MNLKKSKLLSSNWVITLTATLVGVFLALYLNEWIASNKLSNQKSIATENILSEIASNQKHLETSLTRHEELYETVHFLNANIDEEGDIVAVADSMHNFKNKFPEIIDIHDSTLISDNIYKYEGEVYLDISIPHIQLTTIAWETLKNSGFSSSYGFDCLMYLETIDKITSEVLENDKELFKYIIGVMDGGKLDEDLLNQLSLLINYEKTLLSNYQRSEIELKNCD